MYGQSKDAPSPILPKWTPHPYTVVPIPVLIVEQFPRGLFTYLLDYDKTFPLYCGSLFLSGIEGHNILIDTGPSLEGSHVIFDSMSWLPAWGSNKEVKKSMKNSELDSSTLIKWHLKRASGLRKWVDTIKIVEEYPILSRVPARNDFNKKEILQIKIVSLFRFYNMIHVQL